MTREIATLWYRSPEIILGKLTYGPAIDLWSVGTILYEMLTCRVMFKGSSELEMLRLIFDVKGTPARLGEKKTTLQPKIERDRNSYANLESVEMNFPQFHKKPLE